MDSADLLAREEEFKKLNKQLEKKTVSLMKEIEHVMQKQDFFTEFSPSLTQSMKKERHSCTPKPTPEDTPTKTKPNKTIVNSVNNEDKVGVKLKCLCCDQNERFNLDMDFFYAFLTVSVQDKVLPQSFLKDKVSVESVCKFLSSKVKLLQEQTDKLQSSLDRKVKQCESHLTQIAEFETKKLKLMNNCNNLKSISSDMKAKNLALQNRLNEKDRQYKEQRSEGDSLSSEVKRLRSKNANIEAKCISQEQEIERLKQIIEGMKMAEKAFRTSSRNLSASHTSAISRLETKIKHLSQIIDRQINLIDNLKQQNGLIISDVMLKGLEKEYCDFLTKD